MKHLETNADRECNIGAVLSDVASACEAAAID